MTITRAEFEHQGQRFAVVFERATDRAAAGRYVFSLRELRGNEEIAFIVGKYSLQMGCREPLFWRRPPRGCEELLVKAAESFWSARPTKLYRGKECCSNYSCHRCLAVKEIERKLAEGVRRRARLFDAELAREENQRRQEKYRGPSRKSQAARSAS